MSGDSAIQWTDKTWNPTVGCTRVSPGCKNCYAFTLHDMRHEARKNGANLPIQYEKPFKEIQLMHDRLTDPLRWRKGKRIFVNSVSDLFHKDVPDSFIRKAFGVMSSAGQHTFQILTKREDRMEAFFADPENSLSNCQAEFTVSDEFEATRTPTGQDRIRDTSAINGTYGKRTGDGNYWPLPNVHLGVSVEDRKRKDRNDTLRKVPAAVRFLSIEPLLEDIGELNLEGIHWVIVGGESGPGSRPCQVDWIQSIVWQCRAANVPCFVKQLGSNPLGSYVHATGAVFKPQFASDGPYELKLKSSKGGNMDEWPEELRVRQFPA